MRVLSLVPVFVFIALVIMSIGTETNAGDLTASLIEASRSGDINRVRELIESDININARDTDGKTALHHAAENGHMATAELLLEHGANPDVLDNEEHKPLYYALREGHDGTAKVLRSVTVEC